MAHTMVWCRAPPGCNHHLYHHNPKSHKILMGSNTNELLKTYSSFLSLMKYVIPNCTEIAEIATSKVAKSLYSP
jgi:hypothetical protein